MGSLCMALGIWEPLGGVFCLSIPHQVGLDELIDLAIHHSPDVGGLVAGTMILHSAVIEDVATDLGSPLDLLLPRLDLGLSSAATLELLVVELGTEEAHRVLTVIGLGAGLGILDDDLLLSARLGVSVAVAQAYTPLERKVSQLMSAGLTSTSIVSSTRGTTKTEAKLVMRLP